MNSHQTPWLAIRNLLPGKAGDPGRTAADNRLFVNAGLFVARTAASQRTPPLARPARAVWEVEHRLAAVRSLVCRQRLDAALRCRTWQNCISTRPA